LTRENDAVGNTEFAGQSLESGPFDTFTCNYEPRSNRTIESREYPEEAPDILFGAQWRNRPNHQFVGPASKAGSDIAGGEGEARDIDAVWYIPHPLRGQTPYVAG
jgi:hypothetical protein